jgi:hypothetical protein
MSPYISPSKPPVQLSLLSFPLLLGPFWGWIGQIYLWVGFAWAFALSVLAIKQVGKVSWLRSASATLISIALAMGFYMAFIR